MNNSACFWEKTGSFREFLLWLLWNLTSDNFIWCSLIPILRGITNSYVLLMFFMPSMVHKSLSYPHLAVCPVQAEECPFSHTSRRSCSTSLTIHITFPCFSCVSFERQELFGASKPLEHHTRVQWHNDAFCFLFFFNTDFFQPLLRTDMFIITQLSSASHEVNSSPSLDFNFYDLEKIISRIFAPLFTASFSTLLQIWQSAHVQVHRCA